MNNNLSHTLLIVLALITSCTDKRHKPGNDSSKGIATELPLPSIPESLTSPEARAVYLAEHFWDGMDFTDHALSLDTAFMEQNFANYLSVLPSIAGKEEKGAAVAVLLHKAAQDSTALAYLQNVMNKYLRDPNSPMRDEETLIIFYEQLLLLPQLPEFNRGRTAWRLKTAMMNRPGSVAADFSYKGRDGACHTLHGTRTGSYVLLLFYDPECEHCSEITSVLAADVMLAQMQYEGRLTILAIDTESDTDTWLAHKDSLPQSWTVGLDYYNTIKNGELYYLPAMPVIFLLDNDKRVILKDTTVDLLFRTLTEGIQ